MNAPESTRMIGAPIKRKEDQRFLTGRGRYTDDIVLPSQTYAVFLRSPHAHARIESINVTAAKQYPGVVAVFTGADLAADDVGGLPCMWLVFNTDGTPMREPVHPVIAHTKVRHVGDQVAVVIADSMKAARDAVELIDVVYDELPAIIDIARAADPGLATVHDDVPNNTCYNWAHGDKAATEAAFAAAHHVTTLDIVNSRLIPNAIEPRAVNAVYSPQDDEYTLYVANQNPHVERMLICASVLPVPESKLRVIAPDVGGGFGSKIYLYPEDVVLTWASKKICRPVKWTADRSEAFLTDAHGRDHVTKAELALDADGKFLALRVHTIANMGAYLSWFATSVPTFLYATLLAGQYTTPAIYAEVKAVFTNTAPVDAYRGAGRPEATYVIERLVETAARELNIEPAEIRRRNFIRSFPYETPVGLTYDAGDYESSLARALEVADVAGFEARRLESERNGKRRGLGYSCYIEACGIAPSNMATSLGARAGFFDAGTIRVHPTGSVTVLTGSHSHGQGHETVYAQIVADRLGVPFDKIEVVHGDTGRIPFGMGTYGSRSIAVGGSALVKALDKIESKAKKIVAHLLEASEEDIEFNSGVFRVAGTDRTMSFADVALAAYVPNKYPLDKLEPGLDENAFYDPINFTYPAGAYICELEVDVDTGETRIQRFTAVDDFGNVMNPMIVEGQVHGGLGQGIGQALFEHCVYDNENGQLLSGSYMDYAMPHASDLPSFNVETSKGTPSTNPLGVKGCGEAGAIGSPPAVINAIIDALAPLGVKNIQMPATPHRVWSAIQAARSSQAHY